MSHRIRRLVLALVAVAAGALTVVGVQGVPEGASAATATPAYLRHPAKNIAPSKAFMTDCYRVTRAAASQQRCVDAALVDYAKARKSEDLDPLVLPRGFTAMPDVKQLLVIVNLERIDRGLPPMKGLNTRLNALAAQGARANADPTPPPHPSPLTENWAAASNWAGAGASTLLDSFFWMYDDGLDSGNVECEGADRSGCWAHRDNLLLRGSAQQPLAHYTMGAASLPDARARKSMTELFVAGDPQLNAAISTAWAPIVKNIAVGVSASRVTAAAAAHHVAKKRFVVYASGYSGKATLRVVKGAKNWTLSRSACTVKAGHGCAVTITFHATKKGGLPGTLAVKGPHGTRLVALSGRGR